MTVAGVAGLSPTRRVLGSLAGVVAVAVPGVALALSLSQNADASPAKFFMSELATPRRHGGELLTLSFALAGALVVLMVVSALWPLAATRRSRMACGCAAGAGVAISLCGVFPITRELAVHNTAAISAVVLTPTASCLFVRGGGAASPGAWLSTGARLLAFVQVLCVAGGALYVLLVLASLSDPSLRELARALVVWRADGSYVRPLAVAEWVLFASASMLVVAGALSLGFAAPTSRAGCRQVSAG